MSYVSLYCLSLFNILFWLRVINRTRGVGGVLEIRGHLKKEVFFASLPICLAARRMEMSGRLLCFPWLLKLGIRAAGWAELGWVGRGERGTLRGFGSALIRVIITAGTHTHTHTLALVFAVGVSPDSRGFPCSEVITCSAILHGELRYHSGSRINSLSSLL